MIENLKIEDLEYLKEIVDNEEPTADQKEYLRRFSKDIALTIGFLVGIKHEYLIRHIDNEEDYIKLKEKLEKDEDCLAIRHLNNIRSNLILHFKQVSRDMRNFGADYKPIDKMELFEEDFRYLFKYGISVITGNSNINDYLKNINNEIVKRIDRVKKYFPDWVKFKNIRSLFIMPSNIEEESKKFQFYQSAYPYQRYIFWNEPDPIGYILSTDMSILEVAYHNNRESFQDYSKVTDASQATKNGIYEFLQRGRKIQIFVDGENADPYMLASTIDGLSDYDIDKIDKIVVYYDAKYSPKAWTLLKHFVCDIEVQTIPVERIAEEKSLVDHMLVAGVSKAVYRDNADSIILASSDSDFWSVIDAVEDAKFMVMAEREKCGNSFRTVLRENNIFYCYLDSFKTMEDNAFFKGVFKTELESIIAEEIKLINARELFVNALKQSRAEISHAEREMIYDKYIKGLKLTVDSEGNFKIVVPE